ncbi:hypothetical protein [Candidatus Poriferisodalis sp.]|uniref:hypothetical protein n=1 Tax=Candidatus Poriferisodalis sp. TaxID=3101277 RepID=UPI003D1320E8
MALKQDDDTGWSGFLYPAKRARNIATTVPLPFSHSKMGLAPLLDQLERSLPALSVYGGGEANALGEEVLAAGTALAGLDDAPLLDAVLDIATDDRRLRNGVVLPLTDFVEIAGRYASQRLPGLEVWGRHDIAGLEPLDRLMVVGPLYWFNAHQHVFTSPRALQIVVLKWAWYRERSPSSTALEGSRGGAGIRVRPVPAMRSEFEVRAEDEQSSVDWASISHELSRDDDVEFLDPVLARPAILAGRHGVLLPEDGDRSVWLLDPFAPREHRVARVEVADLEPGHVIVLRTSGGGDLIVPIADEILGGDARRLREIQHHWKTQLRMWVRQRPTIQRAAAELRRLGCRRANPQNLQNWLSERSLRTGDRADWQVLMDTILISDDAETVWRAMSRLHSAHSQAGRSIGSRLREMANTSPLDEVLRTGRQVFTNSGGGSMTAFRIEAFAPSTVHCAPERLMVPGEVREEWLT